MKTFNLKPTLLPLTLLLSSPVLAAQNGTMMQYFHWYVPNDGALWTQVENNAPALSDNGFTALWLPPAYKGAGGSNDVGYGVYDMYDLGEFDQKGSVRTKYGTKDQYLNAIKAAHKNNIQIYGDVVFNHRGGADGKSWVDTKRVDWNNRNIELGDKWIEAWVEFSFPDVTINTQTSIGRGITLMASIGMTQVKRKRSLNSKVMVKHGIGKSVLKKAIMTTSCTQT